MTKGQTVKFQIDDDKLLGDVIFGVGVLVERVFGKLWLISPEPHVRLSGDSLMIHEDRMKLLV